MSDNGRFLPNAKVEQENDSFSVPDEPAVNRGSEPVLAARPLPLPERIGRYRIEKILGTGGFGLVYLAHDEQLERRVAVKVPHARLIASPEDATSYLAEARLVAGLTHPHIVPVYDVGSTDQFPCYIVSQYIDGSTLGQKISQARSTPAATAELVAAIAEALHYAHKQRIVHRDVKPGNILIDSSGQPFVVDFGLALREQETRDAHRYAGTPAYMSPEQARGEGHRVDGRSDIFSLGVILYEMLVGHRPFQDDTLQGLLEQVTSVDPKPLRQIDDQIPNELERICLKALSKRATDRYTTAKDLAEDLRYWMSSLDGGNTSTKAALEPGKPVDEPELAAAPGLSKHAFLSYATPDKEAAYRICRLLEEQGIGCWIAPRDVTPGADYGEAIIRAIEGTGATVLLLSPHSNASIHVTHEVERATSKRKRVIPVRLEEIQPGPSLELHLATTHWLDAWRVSPEQVAAQLAHVLRDKESATAVFSSTLAAGSRPIRIVPKGLRSFDEHDADFFLELLPGPRDRNGLPDSIRFWKTRIEETDADKTFSVGLICGPSGCGKSSLVKAGLLPHLTDDVIAVYVEATADETETRLLNGLRKGVGPLPESPGLKETLAALRRGTGIPEGKKVLIVLDQFEQWLHATKENENTELVQALRQCEGSKVQCIVMVRDDFWMAVIRFMRELEVRILEGQNSAAVDLFPIRHADRVLAAFGRSFGGLPESSSDVSQDQKQFLEQAVIGLAQDGKVISVRLALFAEMMKGKAWTPMTLKEVGGTEGIGVTFLEETFSAATAPPEHRYHQKAARTVLHSLLPESGTDIKGHMRSQQELLEASGYANRPRDFDELLRILDSEIRLITPTDPEGKEGVDESTLQVQSGQKYYQLTHDYLVPSLRDWLTRKQKETRRGRAELKLAERSGLWSAKREIRHLPTVWEWLGIRWLTDPKKWTSPQRVMMSKATRLHGLRSALALAGLVALIAIGVVVRTQVDRQQEATRIEGLAGRLVSAEPNQLPDIVKELDANPDVAATYLSPLLSAKATTVDEKRSQLHARLASVSRDKSLVEPLLEELLTNKVVYVGPIRQLLRPYAGELTEKLRAILRDERAEPDRRFRAALALADYVPESEAAAWSAQDLKFVAEQLVSSNAEFQPLLRENLRPISGRLLADLERIFGDAKSADAQKLSAANAFADYAGSDITKLSQLLAVATPEQHAVLYPIVAATPAPSTVEDLGKIAATQPSAELGSVARVAYGQRRANAAVTLLRLGEREKVLPVFDVTDDPEALTQFIFRCRPRGVGVGALLDCLQRASDAQKDRFPRNTRYALLLALGEFSLDEIPESRREALLKQLADWYRYDPSSGVHGATGWLLRHWGQAEIARQVDQTAVPYATDREWFTLAITVTPTVPPQSNEKPTQEPEPPIEPLPTKAFYYTFIVFPAGDYEIGSVTDDTDRNKGEGWHPVKLTRPYGLLDREITIEELIAFKPRSYTKFMQQFDAKPADAGIGADWYDAVGFCGWLGQQWGLPDSDQSYAAPETLDKAQYPREPDPSANWAPRNWPLELGKRGFRLPTESEWEVASRAGARTTYGFGSEVSLLGRFGWFTENSGKHVHPPRELRPGIRGLFDMHGNQFEWTHDWLGAYGVDGITDPRGAKGGSDRVYRGGSWMDGAAFCRSAFRNAVIPSLRTAVSGFRLALSPSEGLLEAAQNKK